MKGKILKSTYYDKFGPNGVSTKAAIGTKKSQVGKYQME